MARFDAPRDAGFPGDFDADDLDFPVFQAPPRRTSRPVAASNRPQSARTQTSRAAPPRERDLDAPNASSRPKNASRLNLDLPFDAPPIPRAKTSRQNPNRSSNAPKSRPKTARPASKPQLRGVHFQIAGVLVFALALLLGWNALAPVADGWLPKMGVLAMRWMFGSGTLLFAFGLAILGAILISKRQKTNLRAFWRGAGTAFLVFLTAKHLGVARGNEFLDAATIQLNGGLVGGAFSFGLRRILGEMGAYVALVALGLVSLLLWTEHTVGELGANWKNRWETLRREWESRWNQQASERAQLRRERELESEDEDWDDEPQLPAQILDDLRPNKAKSPFLEVDWPATEDLLAPIGDASNSISEKSDSIASLSAPINEKSNSINDLSNPINGELAPINDLSAPINGKLKSKVDLSAPNPPVDPTSLVEEPKFLDAPRIEIVDAPPPVSVVSANLSDLDLQGAVAGRISSEELTPQQILELQAETSARDGQELNVPRVARIEKPRRSFGDGPLMPEYFDEGVRALDPPLVPDLEGAEEELQRGVIGVTETLASFKIDARVTDVKRGPVITRYEVQPAPGVRVAAIANLDKDLARSLSALAVRIEAPVPGKNVVGIEVPNKKVHLVRMRDVLEQHEFLAHPSKLAFVLGKDIAGQPKWGDLTKMPHMLIAGATNSGKSVCLNSIIASILVRASPDEVRFSLIDPKRVELTLYRGIPHLMHDVVVEPKQAVIALRRAIEEMDRRYKLFATRGVRNIASFNSKLQDGERPMPYIVIVIDELADLMMTAAAEFEKLICRLAQLARAVGIHLIVATQRPSVNVITGVIKANIPARIAFAVASQVDSRTILDAVGAERLIGMGDMLYDSNNGGKSTRIQGAYLSEDEVNRIVEVVKANYQYEDSLPDDLPTFDLFAGEDDEDTGEKNFESDEKRDALYDDIIEFVKRHNEMSASLIQRKFGIGYPRAGRIVDQLERHGILGPPDGPKPRKVLARANMNVEAGDDEN